MVVPIVDREEIWRVLRDLVAIPSVNPAFPGGTGEAEVAAYVRNYLESNRIRCIEQPVSEGRSNVIGMLPGTRAGRTLLLEAHMDTVQTTGMTIEPFGAKTASGRLYGRGACDTKASLAAMLVVLGTFARSGRKPTIGVHLAAVVDEEYRYAGVARLAQAIEAGELRYEAAIVGEPTGLSRVVAHKGCVRFRIEARGVAGHSSDPSKGVNAIEQAMEIVRYLREVIEPGYEALRHPLVGPPTHCIAQIEGGDAPNTIPGACTLTIDRRTVPGEEPLGVWKRMKTDLERFARETPGLALAVHEPFIIDYAMEIRTDESVVGRLAQAVNLVKRGTAEHGAAYGTDASKLARVGVPSIVFGPGDIRQAHTDDEWVELAEVCAAADALAALIANYGNEEGEEETA
ncbi:M20 family metallopeptidase [Cohnella hashimotonis]|uniref:Probable succinyl-diaminopimelate desuccinylase n=1 Tax=Cohnella hashimotonis TaxID=2826895 RepID=A0ABT6TLT8_9BACL|nr:M20 family metallopeptidase [Cohnella hashimotonis]MDI4647826.1 M20 family metallopeptidase [Cohnella hashimotonis]